MNYPVHIREHRHDVEYEDGSIRRNVLHLTGEIHDRDLLVGYTMLLPAGSEDNEQRMAKYRELVKAGAHAELEKAHAESRLAPPDNSR